VSDYQSRSQGGWQNQPSADNAGQGGYGPGPGGYGQPVYEQRITPPPGRRRRRRGGRALIIVIVLLLILVGVGDQIAKSVTQNQIAQKIQTSAGLSAKPSVNIEGWPFLTQLAAKDFKTMDLNASNVTTTGGALPFSVTAKATGVHFSSLSTSASATVDHISGSVTITFQSLDAYLAKTSGIQGLASIGPDPSAGPNAIILDAGIASLTATVTKTSANKITVKFGALSGGLGALLGGTTPPDQVITIPKLPAGLVVGNPTVTPQGVVIPASASNTTLSQLSPGGATPRTPRCACVRA
jgi:hypothetical protein